MSPRDASYRAPLVARCPGQAPWWWTPVDSLNDITTLVGPTGRRPERAEDRFRGPVGVFAVESAPGRPRWTRRFVHDPV